MQLPGPLLEKFCQALLDAFSRDELRQLVHTCLEEHYDAITGSNTTLRAQILDLVSWTERTGRLGELAACAAAERPKNNTLRAACAEVTAKLAGAGEALPALPNPYRGLEPFDLAHARNYFGREADVDILLARIQETNFIALVGASGSGKSSLVRAGLAAALRDGKLPGSEKWPVIIFKPSRDPLLYLANAIVVGQDPAVNIFSVVDRARTLAAATRLDPHPMLDALTAWRQQQGFDRALLVADQFEEFFTYQPTGADGHAAFAAALAALAEQLPWLVQILTLRADFTGYLQEHALLGPLADRGWINLLHMGRADLRRAIEKPAARAGRRFEDDLVDTILADLDAQPGQLPLLQFALTELWSHQDAAGRLTRAAYRAIHGVGGTIANRAEHQYYRLDPRGQQWLPYVFVALSRMTPHDLGYEYLRQRVRQSDLPPAMHILVKWLTDERLVETDIDVDGNPTVEIVDDALVREWPRLRGWLAENQKFLLWRQRLQSFLQDWELNGRRESDMHLGKDIFAQAEEWFRTQDSVLAERLLVLRALLEYFDRLPTVLIALVIERVRDPDEYVRADVADWMLTHFDDVGANYVELLQTLAQDTSPVVVQGIRETIRRHFDSVPAPIRRLFSESVGAQIEVEVIKGGGMLVRESSELVLRVTNHTKSACEPLSVELIEPSAEYHVASTNPAYITTLLPGQKGDVSFRLEIKVPRQIAVNYRINGDLREPPIYISAIQDNPYVYGDPVRNDFSFFGRREELEEVIQAITKPTKQDILIVGERRTGKTSLIYQLIKRLEKPFVPVYMVLNACEPKTESILHFCLRKIVDSLVEQELLTPDWENHHFPYTEFEDNINELLEATKAIMPNVRIVLLLDEADYLLKLEMYRPGLQGMLDGIMGRHHIDERLQNILRGALQSKKIGGNLRAVVAGTSELSTYISHRSSPFFNHFRFVALKPFTSREIRELITVPASILEYSYSPSAIEQIITLSGGQPYYCQALCYEAFSNALKHERNVVNNLDVDVAEKKRTEDFFGAFLSYYWNRLNRTERRFLAALAHRDDTQGFTHAQIKRLLDWDVIVWQDGVSEFSGGLIEKWTQMALAGKW